jgi:DNA-binding MarR family transcriptional regulator
VSARLAADALGSELLMALVRWYKLHPESTMTQAAHALDLSQTLCSKLTNQLRDAGVVLAAAHPQDKRAQTLTVDVERVRALLRNAGAYMEGRTVHDPDLH